MSDNCLDFLPVCGNILYISREEPKEPVPSEKEDTAMISMKYVGLALFLLASSITGPTYADEEEIVSGETKRGYIDVGEIDTYTFAANAGDSATILIGEIGSPSLQPAIELHAPDGNVVETDHGDKSATIDSANLTQSGTYFIIARDYWGYQTGQYGLSLVKNPGPVNDPNNGGPIVSGETKRGFIEEGDLDAYTFFANAGDSATILIGEIGSPSLQPAIELHAPDGNVVETDHGDKSATIDSANLTQSGTYFIIARDYWGYYTGHYSLSLSRVEVGGTPTIADLADSPDPVVQKELLTLTASGVSDSDGSIMKVGFYRDSNRNGYLDLDGEDQLLGSGSDSAEGWSWTGTVGCFPPIGSNRYFARAMDNDGLWSDPRDCAGKVLPVYPADFRGDCRVDFLDLSVFGLYWLSDTCQPPNWCEGTDLNHSNAVNSGDFARFAEDWLKGVEP